MYALDVLQHLAARGLIPHRRVKDFKTSLNKLAAAYHVALETLDLSSVEATYQETLQTYFADLDPAASHHTQRNTAQNLAQLYRQAHETFLLTSAAPSPRRQGQIRRQAFKALRASSPYRQHYKHRTQDRYHVPKEQWPPEIRLGWETYAAERAIQLRQATRQKYAQEFLLYVSYNLRIEQPPIACWDQLFEKARLQRMLTWMAARVQVDQVSRKGMSIIVLILELAKYQERPEYAALQKWKRTLPKPAKVYDKKLPRHTASLADLDRVGCTLMDEARQMRTSRYRSNGIWGAVRFSSGLIIRLLVRCPRRSREIREMDLGGRLYQTDRGAWQLHYRSHQLKIAEHDGYPNEFRMPWPPDLVSDLEEYLRDYRPSFPQSESSAIVFLTRGGRAMGRGDLVRDRIAPDCFRLLGKHIYPHLFRTLWCDAYLDAHPGDWEGAAAMLNDTPQTVQSWYRQFRVEQHLKKAVDFNVKLFGNGHRKGMSP
jgi:hypothetical protein